jgi:DNA polymerase III alpha subunit
VMVYQEDVLKVAHYFGGLDLADADVLRRMMSGKGRNSGKLAEVKRKYDAHCKKMGYAEETASEVWRQIDAFAGFSFAKGHSASYAVESYQSLWLKTHYPLEFMVAVINNFGGFYKTKAYVYEARRLGGTLHLPCVNRSRYTTTLSGTNIFLGFIHIKSLQEELARRISKEREQNGDYTSLENFKMRLRPSLEQLIILIRIDALRFTGRNKRELLWEAHMLYSPGENKRKDLPEPLFTEPSVNWTLPKLVASKTEDAYDELELLEFPVSLTEFDLLKTNFRGDCMAADMEKRVGQTVRMVGNYIAYKQLRTAQGGHMAFGTFTDLHGNFFDTVHFPPVFKQYPFKGWGAYLILGKITEDYGVPSLEVEKMARLEVVTDERHE